MSVRATVRAARRFVTIYWALVREQLAENRGRLLRITALSGLGALAQGGVVAFLIFFVRHLQSGGHTGFAQADAVLQNELLAIALFAVGICVVAYAGAWASYRAVLASRALARSFHQKCVANVLNALYSGGIRQNGGLAVDTPALRALLLRGSNQLGNALESIINLLEPTFRATVALAILVFIGPVLTVVLLPVLAIAGPVVYRSTSKVHDDSQEFFDKAIAGMFGTAGVVLDSVVSCNLRGAVAMERELPHFFHATVPVRKYFDALDKVRLANERTQFALSMITSGTLVIVLVAVSILANSDVLSWPLALGYLVSLVHLLQAVNNIRSHVTSLSIFYPSAKRHLAVLKSVQTGSMNEIPGGGAEMRTSAPVIVRVPGVAEPVPLEPGIPLFVIAPNTLNVPELAAFLEPLRAADGGGLFSENQAIVLGARARPLEWALETPAAVAARSRATASALADGSAIASGSAERLAIAGGRSSHATAAPPSWGSLEPDVRLALLVSGVLRDPRPVVLFDVKLLSQIRSESWMAICSLLRDRYLLLCTSGAGLDRGLAQMAVRLAKGKIVEAGTAAALREQLPRDLAKANTSTGAIESELTDAL